MKVRKQKRRLVEVGVWKQLKYKRKFKLEWEGEFHRFCWHGQKALVEDGSGFVVMVELENIRFSDKPNS